MSFQAVLENLNPEIVASLKRAIELGKWPNGQPLSAEQRQLCAEAVAAWEARHVEVADRVGVVPPKATPCGDKGDKGDESDQDDDQPLNWV